MRVVVIDPLPQAGRELGEQIEQLLPTADVLLYSDADDAVTGVAAHRPDVVLTTHTPDLDGPTLLGRLHDLDGLDAKLVGVVDAPDPELSVRFVDAGATVVVARPLERYELAAILRHRAGGVP